MKNAQEVYDRIQNTKKEIKELKKTLTDQYEQVPEYLDIQEELKKQRAKRKLITNKVDAENPTIVTKLEDLKIDLASDKEMLNDIVVSTVMRGETVELQNQYQQAVLPIFTVTLKPE